MPATHPAALLDEARLFAGFSLASTPEAFKGEGEALLASHLRSDSHHRLADALLEADPTRPSSVIAALRHRYDDPTLRLTDLAAGLIAELLTATPGDTDARLRIKGAYAAITTAARRRENTPPPAETLPPLRPLLALPLSSTLAA